MAYGVIENGVVVDAKEAAADFAAEQGWVELTGGAWIGWGYENGTFSPPVAAPAPVPDEVSAAQAKTALYQAGIYDDVEAVLAAAPDGLVRIWWQSAQTWRRDHPYILAVATFLDPPLDDDQVDALFLAAAAVPT